VEVETQTQLAHGDSAPSICKAQQTPNTRKKTLNAQRNAKKKRKKNEEKTSFRVFLTIKKRLKGV